jgi:choice-of-anchor A domain-containing protein
MKPHRTLAGASLAPVTLAFALIASAITASAQSLGSAAGFNYFVFGNVSLANSDSEGRVAVGGNATFSNYGVGDKLPAGTGGYSLIVDGNLNYQNGQVFQGSASYGGTLTASGFNVPNGSIVKGDQIDFDAAKNQFVAISASLAGIAASGSFNNQYGTLQFTGTNANLNTFVTSAADINSANSFQISAPTGSTVVINVAGQTVNWDYMGISLGGTDKYHVLYNFYEATTLNVAGISILGSILAPNANVNFSNGNIEGTLVAQTLSGGGEFHNAPFQGTLPMPIPEPSSALLAALAGAGFLVHRRRSR